MVIPKNLRQRNRYTYYLRLSMCIALIAALIYMAFYWWEPLSQPANDYVIYLLIITAATCAAVIGSLVWKKFQTGDPPRHIWSFFIMGLWAWVGGEILWLILKIILPELSDLTLVDLFWIAAYIFFGLSVLY